MSMRMNNIGKSQQYLYLYTICSLPATIRLFIKSGIDTTICHEAARQLCRAHGQIMQALHQLVAGTAEDERLKKLATSGNSPSGRRTVGAHRRSKLNHPEQAADRRGGRETLQMRPSIGRRRGMCGRVCVSSGHPRQGVHKVCYTGIFVLQKFSCGLATANFRMRPLGLTAGNTKAGLHHAGEK
jgi:hypothetical protein